MNKLDMRMIHSVINGEIPGARKTLIFIFAAVLIWIIGMIYSSNAARTEQLYRFQQGRLVTLNELAAQYRQLLGDSSGRIVTAAGDLIPVFSQIVEEAGLSDRLQQISPVTRGISVQMDRLYAEDLVTLLNGLNKHGIRIITSELRALPFQDKRLFSFFVTLEVEN
jgi:hypothetical protein